MTFLLLATDDGRPNDTERRDRFGRAGPWSRAGTFSLSAGDQARGVFLQGRRRWNRRTCGKSKKSRRRQFGNLDPCRTCDRGFAFSPRGEVAFFKNGTGGNYEIRHGPKFKKHSIPCRRSRRKLDTKSCPTYRDFQHADGCRITMSYEATSFLPLPWP